MAVLWLCGNTEVCLFVGHIYGVLAPMLPICCAACSSSTVKDAYRAALSNQMAPPGFRWLISTVAANERLDWLVVHRLQGWLRGCIAGTYITKVSDWLWCGVDKAESCGLLIAWSAILLPDKWYADYRTDTVCACNAWICTTSTAYVCVAVLIKTSFDTRLRIYLFFPIQPWAGIVKKRLDQQFLDVLSSWKIREGKWHEVELSAG